MSSRTLLSLCRPAIHSSRRFMATEATQLSSSSTFEPVRSSVQPRKGKKPILNTAIILNRSPLITRTPTTFERAYYAYQARLRRALSNPFPYEFYFKQGSILETRFEMEEQKRERRAFGPTFGKPKEDDDKEKAAANRAAALQLAEQEGEFEEMMPRSHSSDEAKDYKSLDRRGKRNLYLLLKDANDFWRFPQGGIQKGELLHQAAQRDMYDECGKHMDAWIVSRNPIGHYRPPVTLSPEGTPLPEQVTFFFKAHILQGQCRPSENMKDFAWLTKQEIESYVDKHYWDGIKDVLSDN
ncbi:hypothetical protein D9758_001741 [Tetrapyrgos nigripes]|uniref:Large ribosomal subunit protein mL46 n=1 Tax=Tetrapyrgos nigripes TaxID=182062 RepID=A0A8H5GXK4_9AGAR|nr:hypothetical protein D9758_001741 [Tetrapyrgos nigripes]